MKRIVQGTMQAGAIALSEPLDIPDGTAVEVSVEVVKPPEAADQSDEVIDFASLPFHGMWADREDMQDSVAWVREQRKQWGARRTRQPDD